MRSIFAVTVFAAALGATSALAFDSGAEAKVVVTPLASTTVTATGQPITLPQQNAQVLVSIYDIPPGAALPVHKHPFPRYAYVLAGALQVTSAETGKSQTYTAGNFIVEMIDQWHQGSNIGSEPVKLLVIDQVEEGSQNTLLRK
jgi:quercetin dioxygenase-like cupin family protein